MPVEVDSDEATIVLTNDAVEADVAAMHGRIAVTDDEGGIIVLLTSTTITLELSTNTQTVTT